MKYCFESYLEFLQSASLNQGLGDARWYGSSPRISRLKKYIELIKNRQNQDRDHQSLNRSRSN
jgi:hypothetical protein